MFSSGMPREVARLLAMVVVLAFAASATVPVAASAQSGGGMVTGSGWGETATGAESRAGSGGRQGFGDIAQNTGGTVKKVATVLAGLALLVAIGMAWAQTSVKTLGFAVLMAILASMAISGKLWTAAEDTGKDLSGTTGSVLSTPAPADLSAALAAGRVA